MQKAVQLEPNDPENIQALGISYYSIGLFYQALDYYARCITLDPADAKYYYYRAHAFYYLGHFEEAKPEFRKALQLEPNDPRFLMFYILLLIENEDFTEADTLITKYNHLFPDTEGSRFINAMNFAKHGEKEKALSCKLDAENKLYIYLYLRMADEAIEVMDTNLENMKKSKRTKYLVLKKHPAFRFLHTDPEFIRILDVHKTVYDENLRKYTDILSTDNRE